MLEVEIQKFPMQSMTSCLCDLKCPESTEKSGGRKQKWQTNGISFLMCTEYAWTASQVVHSRVCFAINCVLGLFPLCRGLSPEKKDEHWLWILSRDVFSMALYIKKCKNTPCASALTVLPAHKDGEMEESEALPQVPCSEFQFLFTPPRNQKGKWRRQLVGTQTMSWFWQVPRAARHSLMCFPPSDVRDTMPALQSCSSSHSTSPWSF